MESFFIVFGIIWVVVVVMRGGGPGDPPFPPPRDRFCDNPHCPDCRCRRW